MSDEGARISRAWRGEETRQHKLTERDVLEIRRSSANREAGTRVLASRYGVSRACIQQVIHRETWAWLEEETYA